MFGGGKGKKLSITPLLRVSRQGFYLFIFLYKLIIHPNVNEDINGEYDIFYACEENSLIF